MFSNTVSPLHTNLQVANFQRYEHAFPGPVMEVSSRVWRTLSRACILYKWLCFCVLYCAVLYRVQYLYFKPRMSGSKCKSSNDVAGTTVLFKVLYCKIKNVLFFVFVFYVLFA